MKLGVIGLGNMATAMIGGIIKAGLVGRENIKGADHFETAVNSAKEKFGIAAGEDNIEAISGADYVIMAVKPQVYEVVLEEIKGKIDEGILLDKE